MNKKKLKKIYKQLAKLYNEDEKSENQFRKYIKMIAPDSYIYLTIEKNQFTGACDILETIYGNGFVEDVSYWFYDTNQGGLSSSGKFYTGTINEKEYVFSSLPTYIDFILDYNKENYE